MRLELSRDEADVLREVLAEKLVNIGREINHTDHRDFRNALKARERTLEHIAESLTLASSTSQPAG